MENIINEEILEWVSNNGYPANDPIATNNFSCDDVGDWEGEEERAIEQLNRIMLMLETVFKGLVSDNTFTSLKSQVWRDWSKDTRILDIDELDIVKYVNVLICGNSVKFINDVAA